jgi:hypothetical protein
VSDLVLAGTATSCLIIGYMLGRFRPVRRLDVWAWEEICSGRASASRIRGVAASMVMLAIRPVWCYRVWQRRNDPPRSLAPAPKLSPEWEQLDGQTEVTP